MLPFIPLNADVAPDGVVTVPPVPEIIVHAPAPAVAALAASVTEVNPQVAALV